MAVKILDHRHADKTQADGAFAISMKDSAELPVHQILVTVSAIPAAGTLKIEGRLRGAKVSGSINAILDSIDLTLGNVNILFPGYFDMIVVTPTGFDAGKTYSVSMVSTDGTITTGGIKGDAGAAGTPGVTAGFAEDIVVLNPATGAINLNYAAANVHDLTLTGNITSMTIDNVPATGWCRLSIIINQDTVARTVVWPTGTDWGSEAAPDLSTVSKEYLIILTSRDAGTKWLGLFIAAQADF